LKQWMKVEPIGKVCVLEDSPDSYMCSLRIGAWEHAEDGRAAEVVAVVNGVLQGGRAEIRVQYEKVDYEAHKSNLLVQRAVRQAMKQIEEQVRAYLARD
jgi:hypothetical protein